MHALTRTGIYEEINANVLVVADFRAFNKDRVEQLVELVLVKVRVLRLCSYSGLLPCICVSTLAHTHTYARACI